MVLAFLLKEYNLHFKQNWEIKLMHIDLGFSNSDPDKLMQFAKKINCPLKIVKTKIARSAARSKDKCWRCSWQRRKALLENAEKYNIFNIALGHHQNDVVETALLNMFFNSDISTMIPRQSVIHGRFYFIRPLYLFNRERLEQIARKHHITPVCQSCPFQKESKRNYVRNVLKQFEHYNPKIMDSIFKSLSNIKRSYLP